MIRGIERRRIFQDSKDYEDFVSRLDRLVPELGFLCFAWVLMPNHAHLALQTGPVPLPRLMARLGTGYARTFNGRHRRVGHLLQNRYQSRLVEDDRDLLGLVRYIHCNPLRAGLVPSGETLSDFPWCGHGALTGERPARPFETPKAALCLLAEEPIEPVLSEPRPSQNSYRLSAQLTASSPKPSAAGGAAGRCSRREAT
jgi:REP element-mobilizing transposase RayT